MPAVNVTFTTRPDAGYLITLHPRPMTACWLQYSINSSSIFLQSKREVQLIELAAMCPSYSNCSPLMEREHCTMQFSVGERNEDFHLPRPVRAECFSVRDPWNAHGFWLVMISAGAICWTDTGKHHFSPSCWESQHPVQRRTAEKKTESRFPLKAHNFCFAVPSNYCFYSAF